MRLISLLLAIVAIVNADDLDIFNENTNVDIELLRTKHQSVSPVASLNEFPRPIQPLQPTWNHRKNPQIQASVNPNFPLQSNLNINGPQNPPQQNGPSAQLGLPQQINYRPPLNNQVSSSINYRPPLQVESNPSIPNYNPTYNDYTPPQQNYNPSQNNYYPQNNYNPPQNNYNPPQNNYNPPQNNYNPPQNNYNPPQNNYNSPQNNYNPPQNNYNPPQNNYNPPQNNYNPPQNNYMPPQNNYNPPQNNYNNPQNDYNEPDSSYNQQNNYNPSHSHEGYGEATVGPISTTTHIPVIKNEHKYGDHGSYSFEYQIADGTHVGEEGFSMNPSTDNETIVKKGWYSYTGADGRVYTITYWADHTGFHAQGDHLPTPPPIPPVIQAALEQNAKEEAAQQQYQTTTPGYYNQNQNQQNYYQQQNPQQNYPNQGNYYPNQNNQYGKK